MVQWVWQLDDERGCSSQRRWSDQIWTLNLTEPLFLLIQSHLRFSQKLPPLPIALLMRLLGFLGTYFGAVCSGRMIRRERHGNDLPKLQGRRIAA
jgi:hypothetical protein